MSTLNRRDFLRVSGVGAATVLGIAGCGSSSPSSSSAGSTKGPGPGHYNMDLGGYTGPKPTTKPVTLRLMRQDWGTAADDAWNKQVRAFMKAYPNIKVIQDLVPYGNLPGELRTTFAAGTAPDIIMGSNTLVPSYRYGKIAVPIGDYFTASFKAGYIRDMYSSVTVDGTMYALPSFLNTEAISYNKEIFAAAKVETPPEPATWTNGWTIEQWFETWARLRSWMDAKGKKSMAPISPAPTGNSGPGSNYQQLEQFWIRGQGDPNAPKDSDEYKAFAGISPDGKTVQGYVNNPLAVAGAKNYQKIFTENWSPTSTQSSMMAAGQAATDFNAFEPGVKFAWGTTPLPKAKTVSVTNASDSLIVTTQSKHPVEACALLGACLTVPAQAKWEVAWADGVPPMEPVISALPKAFRDTEAMKANIEFARHAHPVPATPAWFEYDNQMNTTMRNIALGTDPKTALDAAATAIDQQIAKYV